MRSRQEVAMRQYSESARAHYDQHPADEIALHERDLDRLEISNAAREHLVNNRLAHIAAHLHSNPDVHHAVSKMDDSSQIRAIQAIHNSEGRGGGVDSEGEREENEMERTERYLAERKNRSRR